MPEEIKWTPCPVLPVPTREEMLAILDRPNGPRELAEYYEAREDAIRKSKADPFNYGLEPVVTLCGREVKTWSEADRLLAVCQYLAVFGGNRAGKSEWAGDRVVHTAIEHPFSNIICLADTLPQSIITQQEIVWRDLPKWVKELNGKESREFKVSYSVANGFADGVLVLPNGSRLWFATYNQDPGRYEGVEFGHKEAQVIGAWADENMPLAWMEMLMRRLTYRDAKLVWTFTPVKGITPAIKQFLGQARTLESFPAELLAGRVNVADCPLGHMPFIQEPTTPRSRAIYFFTQMNPFGDYYRQVRANLTNKTTEMVERAAYGYARDTVSRAFPNFGAVNIVKEAALPVRGTNYHIIDPAGTRNWAQAWVRVTADNPPRLYFYRDWPDMQRFGEWAVPTERQVTDDSKKGWDGEPGPAQAGIGYGVAQYKRLFRELETIPEDVVQTDPQRERLRRLNRRREEIEVRIIDPRAGKSEHAAEQGGTCLLDQFAVAQRDAKGELIEEPMTIHLGSAGDIEEGLGQINELLCWNKEQPYEPVMNAPRLYVSERCQQVIWALANYTGRAGATGAAKDFVDVVRYAVMGDLQHVDEERPVVKYQQGAY